MYLWQWDIGVGKSVTCNVVNFVYVGRQKCSSNTSKLTTGIETKICLMSCVLRRQCMETTSQSYCVMSSIYTPLMSPVLVQERRWVSHHFAMKQQETVLPLAAVLSWLMVCFILQLCCVCVDMVATRCSIGQTNMCMGKVIEPEFGYLGAKASITGKTTCMLLDKWHSVQTSMCR